MELQVIDQELLDSVIKKAKESPRLRMNYNFHESLDDKCQRLLNAMEPGTVMPIHIHKVAEMYIILQGRLLVKTYTSEGNLVTEEVIDPKEKKYGIQIPPDTWHSVEVLEKDTVIFEVKEGPFIPHDKGGVMAQGSPVQL